VSTKSDLLEKIKKKAKRMQDLSEEIAERDQNVEVFLLKMLKEMDDCLATWVSAGMDNYAKGTGFQLDVRSIEQRIKTIDIGATIQVLFGTDEQTCISGILVRWSKEHQDKTGCEEQLLVDIADLMLQ
jgi:hypothetical protein